jgi:lactoylglutathione lyase
MKIAHLALWTTDVDRLASFWEEMFDAKVGEPYRSRNREGFVSRFLQLADGAAIEIMTGPWIESEPTGERSGYAHVAVGLGSREAVDVMADKARELGILLSGPRMTGDEFYEATLSDPDGNLVEITT